SEPTLLLPNAQHLAQLGGSCLIPRYPTSCNHTTVRALYMRSAQLMVLRIVRWEVLCEYADCDSFTLSRAYHLSFPPRRVPAPGTTRRSGLHVARFQELACRRVAVGAAYGVVAALRFPCA